MRRAMQAMGLWLAAACGTGALDSTSDPETATRAKLGEMTADELPGVQYVVVDERGVVFEAAVGVRDAQSGQAMQPDTLQMAYSTTKVITAVAVMQLVEAGRLQLDAPLSDTFDEHPYGTAVTIRSLLAQTSGVPNPMPLDWFELDGVSFESDAKLQQLMRAHPQVEFEPRTKYGYSNLSYWLLEKAIERAAGLDYATYVRRRIFAPLGVPDSDVQFSPPPSQVAAVGHSRRLSAMNALVHWLAPSEYWQVSSGPWSRAARVVPHGRGYGGLFTHASALALVLSDLLRAEPRLLSPETKQQMFAIQHVEDGSEIDMTLGWVVGELDGVRWLGKPGGGLGFHGNLRIYPELGFATVLLSNRTELTAGPIDGRSDELDAAFVATALSAKPKG